MADTILGVIHDTAQGLHDAGVMAAKTMREFDALCLPPVQVYSAEQIKRIRLRNQASQAVFQWLRAAKKLSGGQTESRRLVAVSTIEPVSVGVTRRLVVAHATAFAVGLATAYLVWGRVA